jgi:CheY-like chemotaxis protein
VGSAEAALELLQQNKFTGCIIDLHLPGMDGWRLLDLIHQNEATARTPCIAITAYHSAMLPMKAREAGFDAYIPKPLEPASFVRIMGQTFGS